MSFALPVQAGRDLPRYLLVYGQLFDAHVVFPNALLARTAVTPVVTGLLLEGGPIVSEAGLAVLYALSIVAWFCVARRFGPVAALTTAAALLHTRAMSCSSTSWRATRCSRPPSRSSRSS